MLIARFLKLLIFYVMVFEGVFTVLLLFEFVRLFLLSKRGLGLEPVGSGCEGDGVVLAVGSDVGVLSVDGQRSVLGLRVVKFAFFLAGGAVTGFVGKAVSVGLHVAVKTQDLDVLGVLLGCAGAQGRHNAEDCHVFEHGA